MRTVSVSLASTAVVAMVLGASSASAATFNVTTTADSGPGSLRQAILDANANAEADTITITATGTIQLATALPTLSSEMTISGPGAANLTVRRNVPSLFAILTVNGPVKLAALTLSNGDSGPLGQGGGAIRAEAGSLEIDDVAFTGNGSSSSRTRGAAIASSVPLTVKRSSFTGNTGYGTLYAASQAATTLIETTFANNAGTAIVFPPANGTLTLDRCTFSGNNGALGVGAIQLQGGTAIIRDSTFSGNTGAQGGDFWTYSDGVTFRLTNVTSTGSSAPALLWDHAATVVMRNTILAGPGARCSLGARSGTQGHNIASDATCNLTDPTDMPNTDPLLGPLANNGGPTQTHALLEGSPAINAGDNTKVSATDQRGSARVSDGTVDIGAYEVLKEVDAGPEAGADAGPDASRPDASRPDTSSPDESSPDSGTLDDAGSDGASEDSGCSCSTLGSSDAPWTSALPAFGTITLLAFARRFRLRRARRHR